jgi:hypothetical protein
MNTRKFAAAIAAVGLLSAGFVIGQISTKYPHMRKAQELGQQAFAELGQVEHNHGPKVDAHVDAAKNALLKANSELIAAAEEADKTDK